ncbi:hypothetical protein SK128_006562 [Halocaridina rubra]|uniref:Uncharacterized protein n=1 Tax=Halocaridina rubra TaxID=373956 RepID=A0AAN8ZSH4_HALRR
MPDSNNVTRNIEENKLNGTTLSWDQEWVSWQAEQKRRREIMKKACNYSSERRVQHKTEIQQLVKKRDKLNNVLVDDVHKAIYCYIPKQVVCPLLKYNLCQQATIAQNGNLFAKCNISSSCATRILVCCVSV